MRIGYGIVSDPLLADLIDRLRTPFNINRVAQAAAIAALADEEHLQATLCPCGLNNRFSGVFRGQAPGITLQLPMDTRIDAPSDQRPRNITQSASIS